MSIIRRIIVLLFFLFLLPFSHALAQLSVAGFQQQVQQIITKVSPACVSISRFDSTGHKRFGTFSGVIVSSDGLVLTAAHATITGERYLIELPSGKSYIGIAKGRIPTVDAAFIKIQAQKELLPFCETGWSYDLSVAQPCLSIAYPASFKKLSQPVVRFGQVLRTLTPEGKMQTSCLMEPGDSGGPVFDMQGRVIATHSKIEPALNENLENPIDNYRKYWDELNTMVSFPVDSFPDPQPIGTDPLEKRIRNSKPFPALMGIASKANAKYQMLSVGIGSRMGEVSLSAWGSVVSLANDEHNKYIVSKSSIVGDEPTIIFSDGRKQSAKVLKRDSKNDLVLLQADGLSSSITIKDKTPAIAAYVQGTFLVSPSYTDSLRAGILGLGSVDVGVSVQGYFGLICSPTDTLEAKIIGFASHIPQKYGLKVGDVVHSVNGIAISNAKVLSQQIFLLQPGDGILMSVGRGTEDLMIKGIVEKPVKVVNKHAADTFAGGPSTRSEGFEGVFVHDGKIRPEECGGPIFDIKGQFMGINISRLSRTSNLGMPTSVILRFLTGYLKIKNNTQTT